MKNNKNNFMKYMFSGVDTKIILIAATILFCIALAIGDEGGAWLLFLLSFALPSIWFTLGFFSWKKYVGGN